MSTIKESHILIVGLILIIGIGVIVSITKLPSPSEPEQVSIITGAIKQTCTQACEGNARVSLAITAPKSTRAYATSEAICFAQDRQLYCARCPCVLAPATLFNSTPQERTFLCSVDATASIAQVSCEYQYATNMAK